MFKTPGSIVDNILIKEIAVCVEIAVFWPVSDSDFWLFVEACFPNVLHPHGHFVGPLQTRDS